METNPGVILQRMGVEVSPDDPRSAEEILNQINRQRIENNIAMEPRADMRAKMAEYAIRAYPLEADK
ncbi:MAG: hypothetical protein ACREGB_00840, partial [Candidatus Saccharimonadales bacterium]